MGRPVRKIEIRKANEVLILESAEKVFAISGYKGAATAEIARQAGIPKANLHYYFKTKANLYREVLKHILDDWMAAASTFDVYHEPQESLRAYVTSKMHFSRQRPYGSRVWAREIMSGAPLLDEFLGTTLKAWLNQRVCVIRRWIREEKIRPVDPHALMYMIWATTQHYADFEKQIVILNDGKRLSDRRYRQRTDEIVALVLGSVGL